MTPEYEKHLESFFKQAPNFRSQFQNGQIGEQIMLTISDLRIKVFLQQSYVVRVVSI